MNIYFPVFIPLYMFLVGFLIWYATKLAYEELASGSDSSRPLWVTLVEKVSLPGLLVVLLGFGVVQYVEYSKRDQYKAYTRLDVARHKSMETGVWVIVDRDVFDVTDFVKKHPAGAKIILQNSGKDATKHYNYHLEATKHFWRRAKIGWIEDEET